MDVRNGGGYTDKRIVGYVYIYIYISLYTTYVGTYLPSVLSIKNVSIDPF